MREAALEAALAAGTGERLASLQQASAGLEQRAQAAEAKAAESGRRAAVFCWTNFCAFSRDSLTWALVLERRT